MSRRRGTASFFGRFDRGSSKGKCGRSISFPATIDRLVRIIERPRAKGARENPFLLLPTNPRLKTRSIDLSNRYPLSIRPERKVSTSSSRFKSEQINGRFRFRLELDFRLWTKFHSLRASSTHTHTYIYILTRIARCIDIAYLIDDIPSIRSFRLSDHEHC